MNFLLGKTAMLSNDEITQDIKNLKEEAFAEILKEYDPNKVKEYFHIIVVGESRSGKSALADTFFAVATEKLAEPKDISVVSEACEITTSFIPINKSGRYIKYIEAPGFGNTGGIKVDQAIPEKLQQYLKQNEDPVHAVIFCEKASEYKLTSSNRYMISNVQKLFANDVKDSFYIFCTFSEGPNPECLTMLNKEFETQGITLEKGKNCFIVNNSVSYKNNSVYEFIADVYHSMNKENCASFFKIIEKKNVPITQDVLEARKSEMRKPFAQTQEIIDARMELRNFNYHGYVEIIENTMFELNVAKEAIGSGGSTLLLVNQCLAKCESNLKSLFQMKNDLKKMDENLKKLKENSLRFFESTTAPKQLEFGFKRDMIISDNNLSKEITVFEEEIRSMLWVCKSEEEFLKECKVYLGKVLAGIQHLTKLDNNYSFI